MAEESTLYAQLRDKGIAAMAANHTFLALTTPTNADVLAQVRLLTRTVNGILKVLLPNQLADQSDT